ncbi:MAG: cob(I)yrinic acid a,c-diamide adenosyltransferase [Verrucomicrobia bacterium]|nr:MAG: cob(I)yrinic acid a,c-diamide adenosyltransferase [Verrucomicrobiota bacterium]
MNTIADRDERHARAMARKKQVVDSAIAAATEDRGVIVVLTGNGKGKSTSAFGMVARAVGHGLKVGVVQFVKSREGTGEERFFTRHPEVQWHVLGAGFTWETQNRDRDAAAARHAWAVAREMLQDPGLGLVVLDEMTYAFLYDWLEIDDVVAALENRPRRQHVVITGRHAPNRLREAADTVAEINDVKHAFRAGIRAQRGIDL